VAFLLLFVEESDVPPLVPGDALMPLSGMRAAEGKLALIAAIGVLEPATVLGGSVLHWVWVGCAVVERLDGYVGVTRAGLKKASASPERHGGDRPCAPSREPATTGASGADRRRRRRSQPAPAAPRPTTPAPIA